MITFQVPNDFYPSECVHTISFDTESKLISIVYRNYQQFEYTYMISNESDIDYSFKDIMIRVISSGEQYYDDPDSNSIGSFINQLMQTDNIQLVYKGKVEW